MIQVNKEEHLEVIVTQPGAGIKIAFANVYNIVNQIETKANSFYQGFAKRFVMLLNVFANVSNRWMRSQTSCIVKCIRNRS